MTISTVYDLGMAKVVNIQVKGVPRAVEIIADKVEASGDKLKISKGGTPVGEFNVESVEGWWISGKDD